MRAHDLRDKVNLLLALALVVSGFALMSDEMSWWRIVAQVVTICAIGVTVSLQSQALRENRTCGEWQERTYVLLSMREARRRGLNLEEWATGYIERTLSEARADQPISDAASWSPDTLNE